MSARKKKNPAHAGCPDTRTTVRAKVTEDEHEAIRRFAKYSCSATIEDFVRQAIDSYLERMCGKGLTAMAADVSHRPKFVQGELF